MAYMGTGQPSAPPLLMPPAAAAQLPVEVPSILSLPTEVELQIFANLPAADLASCVATCRAWHTAASAPPLWKELAARRWRHGAVGGQLGALALEGCWSELYRRRRQLDARVLSLLCQLQWPSQRWATLQQLQQPLFPDIRDVLLRLAGGAELDAEWPDAAAAIAAAPCGTPYWARTAYEELQVHHCAAQMREHAAMARAAAALLEERAGETAEAAGLADGAAEAIAAGEQAAAPGPAGAIEQQPAGEPVAAAAAIAPAEQAAQQAAPASEPESDQQQGVEGDVKSRLRQKSDEQLRMLLAMSLEDGALELAALHHPFADLGWVRQALDGLGDELKQRMAAAGVYGGLPALRLLSQLLFGPGPPARHPNFASIPPPDGYGLELKGNRERYYDAPNSLLDSVLSSREGIPVSLGVIHAAVGNRAGLPVKLLNVPMHVVCGMADGPDGGAPFGQLGGARAGRGEQRCWYIDVFNEGQIMDEAEFSVFLQGLGLPAAHHSVTASQVMPPWQCWLRQCRNLLHIHREQDEYEKLKGVALLMAAAAGEGTADGTRAVVDAANACMACQQLHEAAQLLSDLLEGPYQVQLGNAAPMHMDALRSMVAEIDAAAERQVEEQMRVHRRAAEQGLLFRVGQVLRHRRYNYRGVIIGWDPECRASEEWMQQMGVDRLAGGRHQPFYRVLPDPEDRPGQVYTYVAQENIEKEPLPPQLYASKPGFALHPEVGRYFSALAPSCDRYMLNAWMRHCWPED